MLDVIGSSINVIVGVVGVLLEEDVLVVLSVYGDVGSVVFTLTGVSLF